MNNEHLERAVNRFQKVRNIRDQLGQILNRKRQALRGALHDLCCRQHALVKGLPIGMVKQARGEGFCKSRGGCLHRESFSQYPIRLPVEHHGTKIKNEIHELK